MAEKKKIKKTEDTNQEHLSKGALLEAKGSIFNRFDPSNNYSRYNSTATPIYDIEEIPTRFSDQAKLARKYCQEEPITGTVVDVLSQFSIGEIENIVDDEEVKKFFDALLEDGSNLKEAIKWISSEYYTVDNVFPVRSDPGEKITASNGATIPTYQWTVLNPENVDIVGTLLFNQSMITLKPNQELLELVDSNNPAHKELLNQIPQEIRKYVINKQNIPIPSDKVYHIARGKKPFEKYAVPFIMRNIKPLRVKEKLMQMDMSTIDGVINQLVTMTVGSDEHPATQKDLQRLAQLVATPTKAYVLIWDHTLKVEFHKPEANFFDPKKYEQVNADIAAGYGIARAVISEGGTYASQTVAVQSLIQWLEWGRDDIKKWIEHEYKMIAKENGLKTYPKVRFKKVALSEDKLIKNVLFGLFDRGVISAETLARETGHDINVEVGRQEKEIKLREKGLLSSQSPYQQSQEGKPGRPEGAEDEVYRDDRDNPKPHGGSLQAKANMVDDYTQEFTSIYDMLLERIREGIFKSEDRDIRDDFIDASILMFLMDINRVSSRYLTESFGNAYKNISGRNFIYDLEAFNHLNKLISWNSEYTFKLANDLRGKLKSALDEPDSKSIDKAISKVFSSNRYRTALFGKAGIATAKAYAENIAYKQLGKVEGLWHCRMTERSCDICKERHGKTFDLEDVLSIFPAHNHCECSIEYM